MITTATGDILNSIGDAIIVPINCSEIDTDSLHEAICERYVKIKHRFLQMYELHLFQTGNITVLELPNGSQHKYLLAFPTRRNSNECSQPADIQRGLSRLQEVIRSYRFKVVDMPMLNCSNGCLDKEMINRTVNRVLNDLECEVRLYPTKPITIKELI